MKETYILKNSIILLIYCCKIVWFSVVHTLITNANPISIVKNTLYRYSFNFFDYYGKRVVLLPISLYSATDFSNN